MFVENKYTKIYHRIIEKANKLNRKKTRTTNKNYVYFESHHIIPRCMGGEDQKENLVLLTAREHFICHYLLCKMVPVNSNEWHSLVRAFAFMYAGTRSEKRYYNSRLYEAARRNIGIVMSKFQSGEDNSQYDTIWVTNTQLRECIKIPSSSLKEYENKGYIKKRVVSWDSYDKKIENKKQKQLDSITRKINDINQKILVLENNKNLLEEEWHSLKDSNLQPSHS